MTLRQEVHKHSIVYFAAWTLVLLIGVSDLVHTHIAHFLPLLQIATALMMIVYGIFSA